ncbi:MAG: hypothetical protein WBM86_00215, partial [Waterburya sp.]
FSGIRVAVSIEKSVLPDTHTSPQGKCERLHAFNLGRKLLWQKTKVIENPKNPNKNQMKLKSKKKTLRDMTEYRLSS